MLAWKPKSSLFADLWRCIRFERTHGRVCEVGVTNGTRPNIQVPDDIVVPVAQELAKYKRPVVWKSCWQIVNSLLPFGGLWYLMYLSISWSYSLTLLLAVPAAGFLVRIFIIQHDCGHHSFFRSRRVNDVVGYVCGILTLTPYYFWKRTHARHHVSSGDLGHRGQGDVGVLTVDEYRCRSRFGRLRYRLYRNPVFMFVLGAGFLFLIRQRFTFSIPRSWRRERLSVHATNGGIFAMIALAWCTIGLPPFFLVHIPIVILAAAIGSWLFFVQHQFEHAYWQPHESWDFTRSALDGSSYYCLPPILQWFTGNIGFHHIHHFDSRIPNYNLPNCYAAQPAFQQAVTLGIRDSFRCAKLKLWDEQRKRLVTFAEADSPTRLSHDYVGEVTVPAPPRRTA
jgi:acyl-lipid omega-6 desaturase (Delta-12 desaturase)